MGRFKIPTCKALIVDIEGTVTSISFVKDVLIPYVNRNVKNFIQQQRDDPEVAKVLVDLIALSNDQATVDPSTKAVTTPEEWPFIVENVKTWVKADKKHKALKQLQSIMSEKAYESGAIQGHIYPEVKVVLEDFKRCGIPIYVYSSGSVQAQKLLFSHTEYGDITGLFSGYFDTHIGPKVSKDSYKAIAAAINIPPKDILFLTDVEKEAYPASDAGLQVEIVVRPGNAPLQPDTLTKFKTVTTFESLVCGKL